MAVTVNEAVSGIPQGGGGGGGGGDFAANATQTDPAQVSVISIAGDLGGAYGAYIFQAAPNIAAVNVQVGSPELQINIDNNVSLSEVSTATRYREVGPNYVNRQSTAVGAGYSDTTREATNADRNVTVGSSLHAEDDSLSLDTNVSNILLTIPAATGAETADFTNTTAPVAGLTITNWVRFTLNDVDGYIPFLSA